MNERIKELYEQSLNRVNETDHYGNPVMAIHQDPTKFAELIVQECADVGSKFSQAHPEDIRYQIKRHFGVEE